MKYLIEVERAKEAEGGRPSMGPVYRSVSAKDGLTPPVPGLDCSWDVFRLVLFRFLLVMICKIGDLENVWNLSMCDEEKGRIVTSVLFK